MLRLANAFTVSSHAISISGGADGSGSKDDGDGGEDDCDGKGAGKAKGAGAVCDGDGINNIGAIGGNGSGAHRGTQLEETAQMDLQVAAHSCATRSLRVYPEGMDQDPVTNSVRISSNSPSELAQKSLEEVTTPKNLATSGRDSSPGHWLST